MPSLRITIKEGYRRLVEFLTSVDKIFWFSFTLGTMFLIILNEIETRPFAWLTFFIITVVLIIPLCKMIADIVLRKDCKGKSDLRECYKICNFWRNVHIFFLFPCILWGLMDWWLLGLGVFLLLYFLYIIAMLINNCYYTELLLTFERRRNRRV